MSVRFRITVSLFILLILSTAGYSQKNELLMRYPSLSPDGKQVAFSYQGDIWTVPSTGGRASRLTVNEAYEFIPKWSPDGKQIAFSGSRYGNNDIFLIPSAGGQAKRLTYHSISNVVSSWTGDGKILFSTAREFNQIERPQEVYSISSKGGTESRFLDAVGFDPALSPDGRFLAFVRGDINPVFREDYRGSSNRDVWLYDTKAKQYSRLTSFTTNDILPQWSGSRTVYFASSNSGRYNIYRVKIDDNGKPASEPEQLTDFKDNSVRFFNLSADGSTIVIERDKNLYLMKTNGGSPQLINVEIGADDRLNPVEAKTFNNNADEYAVSPDGKLIAFVIRGEVFVKENDKEKSRSVNLSDSPFRDMNPAWLNDSTLIFCSDREDNNFEIYLAKSSDKSQPNIFSSLKHEVIRLTKTDADESSPVVSNDGKKIAYTRGRGELITADISPEDKLSGSKTLLSGWATPGGVTWSPDNLWLAYSLEDLYFNEEIFIHAADNSTAPVNISMHPRSDSNPYWSADGSKLGFISARNNRNNDVWFVWLKKSDWEKSKQDWDESEPAAEKKDAKTKEKSDKKEESRVKPIQIDFDDIYKRLVQVTSFPGDEGNLVISKDGQTFYYTGQSSTANGRDLYSIKWNGKDLKELTKGGSNPMGVDADREGKYLFYMKRGGSLTRHDLKTDKPEPLPYSAKMTIDYPAERLQVFEEAWRTIRDGFYDPNFHGKNWNALHDKYKDLCVMASTNTDFRDMFNNMLGELNASHMGFMTREREENPRETTGLLGIELTPSSEGMLVMRVIPNTPADKETSKLSAGDIIISVNGSKYSDDENFYSLLNNTVDEKVLLTVKDKSGKEREVAIRPAASLRDDLYNEWVQERKKLTDQYSKGRLGYIHIRGMDMPSFEEFERELTAAGYGKDGILIDVRYNGGGFTTDYLMTVLTYRQHAYTIPRGASDNLEKDKLKFREYYPTGERLVFAAWTKPSIALCNEGSYSNAEIFSHAYKTLGIGKLVGVPTNGSVISTGGRGLLDGSFVRLPFRGWFTKATDKNQELGPAVPDIIVYNTPDWIAKGTDDQLKAAVDELLKEIDRKK